MGSPLSLCLPVNFTKDFTMSKLEKFAYADMIYLNTPSPNKVGYFSPTILRSELIAGSVSIQAKVTLEEGACICTDNGLSTIGDINPNSNHVHPGQINVEKGAWFGYVGNESGPVLDIGHKADGTLILNGGKALFEKGDIVNAEHHVATIKVNEGMLTVRSLDMANYMSMLTVRQGIVRANELKGKFTTWIYSGLVAVKHGVHSGPINITGSGALLFGAEDAHLTSDAMGSAGINFVGDGGALIVRLHDSKGSLSRTYEAEAVYDSLLKEGKISRDGEVLKDFTSFKMEKIMGTDTHSYAVLRPIPTMGERSLISEMLRTLLYGSVRQKWGL
jgi:hypothetical protein